jgi:hypothetical protein
MRTSFKRCGYFYLYIIDRLLTLSQLRSKDSAITQSAAAQAEVVKSALRDVTNSEPFLPFPGSILPALVALRNTHETIVESRAYLETQKVAADREKRRLEADQANLRDQRLLTEALSARITSLREELASSADLQPEDGFKRRREELQARKKRYDKDARDLFRALRGFIDERLAGMLAAEELGGPVVGDLMDVDADDLVAGFSAQGKLKKAREPPNDGKRQQRLDEIWGEGTSSREEGSGRQDETTEAAREVKELIEALLNQLQEAQGDTLASYVTLPRESAAARFLVRSKVALFHPKDATRLRLVDFGRELDE